MFWSRLFSRPSVILESVRYYHSLSLSPVHPLVVFMRMNVDVSVPPHVFSG